MHKNHRLKWQYHHQGVNWHALSDLYRLAPLGEKKPEDLHTAFANSMYKCFVYDNDEIVAVGRVLADGVDCAYLCDIAVLPDYQGTGLGKAVIRRLMELSAGHRKIILYAKPGKEGFYKRFGFSRMPTAMGIFENREQAFELGLLSEI